jgi:hypothetical protein
VTPEGKVKKTISKLLDRYEKDIYRYMPVPGRFGTKTLDYLACHLGRFFSVEAKRPGEDLTEYQKVTRGNIEAAGGVVFKIDGEADLDLLRKWLDNGYASRTP